MKNISTREMRQELPHLEDVLSEEGELIITRHGKPIARLLPVAGDHTAKPSHAELRARMPHSPRPSAEVIREDRDER